ncbi:hypothetical protein GCM10010254_51390 [Streptomyces chromofuscus]|nr:hypothetical protein GCM10010254_51390 [Streptomyces chromofuscus]
MRRAIDAGTPKLRSDPLVPVLAVLLVLRSYLPYWSYSSYRQSHGTASAPADYRKGIREWAFCGQHPSFE